MKIRRRNLVLLFFIILFSPDLKSQSKHVPKGEVYSEVVMASLYNYATDGATLTSLSVGKLIPLDLYSPAQRTAQRIINSNVNESVVTYLPVSDSSEWSIIDREDITPHTWKWVDMEQVNSDHDTSIIHLRRPVWWLKEVGANKIGDQVYIDLPEMGINGYAIVINIRPNQLDTRLLKEESKNGYATRPITGKFTRKSNDIYNLYFDNQGQPVGVTGNHRFWSVSRNTWIAASHLDIGEKVKSTQGYQVLSRREKIESTTVYNLEIYRTHNYIVSKDELLVHNECWDKMWSFLYDQVQNSMALDNQFREMMGIPASTSLMRKGMTANWDLKGPVRRVIYTGNHIDEDPFEIAEEWFTSLRTAAWEDGKRTVIIKFEITEAQRLFPEFSGMLSGAATDNGFTYLGTETVKHNGRDMTFMVFRQDKFSVVK